MSKSSGLSEKEYDKMKREEHINWLIDKEKYERPHYINETKDKLKVEIDELKSEIDKLKAVFDELKSEIDKLKERVG
jgi:peptidoglycan hydrolase CwlO-like protein